MYGGAEDRNFGVVNKYTSCWIVSAVIDLRVVVSLLWCMRLYGVSVCAAVY